jgi:hypothetical protein
MDNNELLQKMNINCFTIVEKLLWYKKKCELSLNQPIVLWSCWILERPMLIGLFHFVLLNIYFFKARLESLERWLYFLADLR